MSNKIKNIFKNRFRNNSTFIVAEISANHNKKISNVIKIIKQAKKIGLDAIKLQLYHPEKITINANNKDFLISKKNSWGKYNSLYELYKKACTPYEWYDQIKKECIKNGVILFSSVFDLDTLNFLEKKRCPIYKIASPEITDIPLIEKVAKTKKPLFISTGLAEKSDIDLAIKTIKKWNKNIVLMKCTSAYPAPLKELNLKTMQDYEKRYDVRCGFSDHSISATASTTAVALGARVIEKHIMLDKIKSVDNFFSLNIKKFSDTVKKIRDTELILGKVDYRITKNSKKNLNGRRSLYYVKDIEKNHIIKHEHIKSIRPSFGEHPRFLNLFLGKKIKKNVKKGTRASIKHIKK